MRAFASAMLMIGGVLGAFATPSAGQELFADSVGQQIVEAGRNTSASCNPEDIVIYGPQLPSASERPGRVRRIQEKRTRLRERASI